MNHYLLTINFSPVKVKFLTKGVRFCKFLAKKYLTVYNNARNVFSNTRIIKEEKKMSTLDTVKKL